VLPEILPAARLVKANGTVEMLTLVAILGGLWGGAALYDHTRTLTACYLVSIGLYATALVLNAAMQRTPQNHQAQLRRSVSEFGASLFSLARHPRLGRVLLGCGMFWFAGAVLRSNLQGWGLASLQAAGVTDITNQKLALLKIGLIAGIVAGSLLAGQLHKVGELGWVRRYGFLMAASILALGVIGGEAGLVIAVALLVVAGLAAGLLLIPLNAALQHEGDHTRLGKTIAVQNFVDYFAMLLGAGFLQLLSVFNLTPGQVFIALAAALTVLALALRVSRPATIAPSPALRVVS
jgi:LPLT family lysophospholipid transporter-like MFS transporter